LEGQRISYQKLQRRLLLTTHYFYNTYVKTWDVILIGGGIIGLSLAIELRKRGVSVLILERGEPGREASHAAAGMLSDCGLEMPEALLPLARASARMYPEFAHDLQDESGINVDLRDQGSLMFLPHDHRAPKWNSKRISVEKVAQIEPELVDQGLAVFHINERTVDPRALTAAALRAAKHREIDIASGTTVTGLLMTDGRTAGVVTNKSTYQSETVVNCAGAWAGQISGEPFPTRPVKGQMLCVVGPKLTHVLRAPDVYLVPRSDGRVLIGATVEESGYDKRTVPETIQRLRRDATKLVPAIAQARILEDWAGLRPGTPDALPILGATDTPGYFVATGHFRDGVLLAPVTARLMAQIMTGATSEHDLSAFSPARFKVRKTA